MPEVAPVIGGLRVKAATASDRGRVRTGNEDRVHADVGRGVFAVVDGVGGHAAGEVAATIAVDVIAQRLARPLWSPEQRVREAIALANNEIFTQAASSPTQAGMTCVLTVALVTDHQVTVGHVGDTRLYLIDSRGIRKLTHDHSPVGEREDAGELTEAEAMRHPRRNEVFRDVGSGFHEPDDADFIEVTAAPFDDSSALLLCSDGLTDMVGGAAIERTVRENAGHPQQVAEALILAANEAGGKDNVSVVYVEGEDFARAATAARVTVSQALASSSEAVHGLRALLMTRGAWLLGGLIAGLAVGLALAWMLAVDDTLPLNSARTLRVSHAEGSDYPSIAAALEAAAPNDTVVVDPGEYAEAIVLPDAVNLAARDPGTVTLVAPPTATTDVVAVTATGATGNRISGIRVLGRAERPLAVGLRLSGHNLQLDDVTVEGAITVGVDVANEGDVAMRTSRFDAVTGVPVRVSSAARSQFTRNVFVRPAGSRTAAIDVTGDAAPELQDNVFIGYAEVIHGAGRHDEIQQHNVIVAAPAATPPGRRPR